MNSVASLVRADLEAHLRQHPLFSMLDEPEMAVVLEASRQLHLKEGEMLFDVTQRANRFFMVVEGQIKLYRLSESGHEKIIEISRSGRLFAEALMFMQRPYYPVNATAVCDTRLCAIDNQSFLQLLRQSNGLCLKLLGDMSMRLHGMINEIDHLTLQNATFRVVNYLTELLPENAGNCCTIELTAPKQTLASLLSTTPETFSRIIHSIARDGIVTIYGKSVEVHDIQRLRRYGQ